MLRFWRNGGVSEKWAKLVSLIWVLSAGGIWLSAPCKGEPLFPTEWIAGPATANLGRTAQISIPEGYKFTDAQGARPLLEAMRNPVPKGLAGLMTPDAGGSLIIFTFVGTGYMKEDGKDRINPEAILKDTWKRVEHQNVERMNQGLPPISSTDWELKPRYDAADHTLEWAIRAETRAQTRTEAVVNHTVCMLGRRGVLLGVAVQPYTNSANLVPLRQLVRGISFKHGERYADYRKGDRISPKSLTELITTDNDSEQVADSPEGSAAGDRSIKALWIVFAVLAGVGIIGIVLLVRIIRRSPPRYTSRPASRPAWAAPLTHEPAARHASRPIIGSPGVPAMADYRLGSRRRRGFDYNRYLADLVAAVTSQGMPVESAAGKSHSFELFKTINSQPDADGRPSGPFNVLEAHSELFANQTALIEEQKRLIQEQSRLIAEKSKLIAEKNELLKIQSELMGNKLL